MTLTLKMCRKGLPIHSRKRSLEIKTAETLAIVLQFFDMKDAAGRPWCLRNHEREQHTWIEFTVPRAGVRTVSSTQIFDPRLQDEATSDQEPSVQWQQHQIEAAFTTPPFDWDSRSRSWSPPWRSRSRSRSPATSISVNMATPQTHAWYSEVDPRQDPIPMAQEDPIPVPVLEETDTIGYIWAHPLANAGEVVQNFADELHIECLIDFSPMHAVHWRDMISLEMMGRWVVLVQDYLDIRQTRWELYQATREIPLMSGGLVDDTVVVPMHLTLLQLQARLDYRAPFPQVWHAVAVDRHNRMITRRDLPTNVRPAIEGLDRLRRRVNHSHRAAMLQTSHDITHMEHTGPQVHSVWTRGIVRDFVVAWVVRAHHESHCEPYLAMLNPTAYDLIKKVAQKCGECVHDMRLTTHTRLIKNEEKLVDLVGYKFGHSLGSTHAGRDLLY